MTPGDWFQNGDGALFTRRRNGQWCEVNPREIELILGKPFRKNTNEWRRAKRDDQLRNREGVETPLRQLGTLITRHRFQGFIPSIEERMNSVSTDLLVETLVHVEARLIRAASAPPNAKTRKREIWLGHWAQRISAALARRPPMPFHGGRVKIDHIWHFDGPQAIPAHMSETPFDLSEIELVGLTMNYAVMLYRSRDNELVLALDKPNQRFRQR